MDAHNAVRRVLNLGAVDHPYNLFPDPNGPEILDPEGDQLLGSGINPAGTTDGQDILSGDFAYDAANRQIVYTMTMKNLSLRTEGNSWIMSSNFGEMTIYVTATASDTGTMSYSYGKIDNSLAIPSQENIGDADSGEISGNRIIIRLSVDKLTAPAALGYDPVGVTTTATEVRAQFGILLLFASDTANGSNFKVE